MAKHEINTSSKTSTDSTSSPSNSPTYPGNGHRPQLPYPLALHQPRLASPPHRPNRKRTYRLSAKI